MDPKRFLEHDLPIDPGPGLCSIHLVGPGHELSPSWKVQTSSMVS